MTQIDVNVFLGCYPFRDVGETDAQALLGEMDRIGTDVAWVSHLPAMYGRDPAGGNAELYRAHAASSRLRPVPTVDPTRQDWRTAVDEAVAHQAPAVRCDPALYGAPAGGDGMKPLIAACAAKDLPLMMAVRLEDLRQRRPEDVAADLQPWVVRQLIRADPAVRLIVTHADREFIEQVHFGSTPTEAARILWDISWIWGPPEDQLELLLRTVGTDRFTFGTGMPLRLAETSVAKLDLLDPDPETRDRLTADNLRAFLST